MIAGIVACNGNGDEEVPTPEPTPAAQNGEEEVEIEPDPPPLNDPDPDREVIVVDYFTYIAGTHGGAELHQALVDRFNAMWDGVYRLDIIHVPQDDYDEFIKQMALIGELPTLVDHMHDVDWQLDFIAANNMSYDLGPWLNENPQIRELMLPESLDFVTRNGRVAFLPAFITNPVGLFYNSVVWEPSRPIRDMSWDEFLTELGDNDIAFMTGENAWGTQLMLTAAIAYSPGGVEWLRSYAQGDRVVDYNVAPFIEGVRKLQNLLQNNAAASTLGATFAEAANSFYHNEAVIINNGPWMFPSFGPTGADNWGPDFDGSTVVKDLYPGNIALSNNFRIGLYWLNADADDDQIEAALAFLEFFLSPEEVEGHILQAGGLPHTFTMSDAFRARMADDPLLMGYMDALAGGPTIVPRLDEVTFASIAQPDMPNLLPALLLGEITPEEFAEQLTILAQEIERAGG